MTERGKKTRIQRDKQTWRITITLLLLALTAFVIFRLTLKAKINSRLKAIRAQGYPVTHAELDKYYSIPDTVDNAADVIIDAIEHLRYPDDDKRRLIPVIGLAELPEPGQPFPEPTMTLIAEHLETNEECLTLLHQAAHIEHCKYPWDVHEGILWNTSLNGVKKCIQLLELETIYHVENKQSELAVRSIVTALKLAESLSKEPTTIAQLIRMSCKAMTTQSIEYAVNRGVFTSPQVLNLMSELETAEDMTSFWNGYIGNRCEKIVVSSRLKKEHISSSPGHTISAFWLLPYKLSGLKDYDLLTYLNMTDECIAAARLPAHQRKTAYEILRKRVKGWHSIHLLIRMEFISSLSLSAFELRVISQMRSARTALAIELYRIENGNPPESLSELIPSHLGTLLEDPFDGNPLRYRKLNPGYIVYSIAEDLTDQAGMSREDVTKGSAEKRMDSHAGPRPRTSNNAVRNAQNAVDKSAPIDYPFKVQR